MSTPEVSNASSHEVMVGTDTPSGAAMSVLSSNCPVREASTARNRRNNESEDTFTRARRSRWSHLWTDESNQGGRSVSHRAAHDREADQRGPEWRPRQGRRRHHFLLGEHRRPPPWRGLGVDHCRPLPLLRARGDGLRGGLGGRRRPAVLPAERPLRTDRLPRPGLLRHHRCGRGRLLARRGRREHPSGGKGAPEGAAKRACPRPTSRWVAALRPHRLQTSFTAQSRRRAARFYRLRITTVGSNGHGAVSTSTVNTWTVHQGQTTIIGTTKSAEAVNDKERVADLENRKGVASGVAWGLLGAGLVAGGVGGYELALLPKTRYGMGDGSVPGIVPTSVGTGLLLGALYVPAQSRAHREHVPNWYTEEQASGRVDEFNSAKMKELGFTKDDVLGYLKSRSRVDLTVMSFLAVNQVCGNVTFRPRLVSKSMCRVRQEPNTTVLRWRTTPPLPPPNPAAPPAQTHRGAARGGGNGERGTGGGGPRLPACPRRAARGRPRGPRHARRGAAQRCVGSPARHRHGRSGDARPRGERPQPPPRRLPARSQGRSPRRPEPSARARHGGCAGPEDARRGGACHRSPDDHRGQLRSVRRRAASR